MNEETRVDIHTPTQTLFNELLQIETDTWEVYMIAARELGVTENELWILLDVASKEAEFCQADLARKLHIPAQTLNSALNKMTKKGWITLEPMKGSNKSKRIVLTEEGKRKAGPVVEQIHEAEMRAFGSLDHEQAVMMLTTIRLYLTRFTKEMNDLFSPNKD